MINQQKVKIDKVLSWINGSDGFRLSVGYDENLLLNYTNVIKEENIREDELGNGGAEIIADALVKHIKSHPQNFQLYRWKHLNKTTESWEDWEKVTGGAVWWSNGYDREVKYRGGDDYQNKNTIHPGAFLTEARYVQVYELIVENLRKRDYNAIDKDDETKSHLDVVIQPICSFRSRNPQLRNYQRSDVLNDKNAEFKIKNVWVEEHNGYPFLLLQPTESLKVDGKQVNLIAICERKFYEYLSDIMVGNRVIGNTISINCVGREGMNFQNGAWIIGPYFDNISLVNTEAQKMNQELMKEEEKFASISTKLLELVEKNKKMVEEGEKFGLHLTVINDSCLDIFQSWPFFLFDERARISPDLLELNKIIREKKLNTKHNIEGIYQRNKKMLSDRKKRKKGTQKSEKFNYNNELLNKLKESVISKINQAFTEKNNLKNINLTTLENGKYQNWAADLDALTTIEQVVAYKNAFLTALLKSIAAASEQTSNKSLPLTTSTITPKEKTTNVTDEIMQASSLIEAKNIAKTFIWKLANEQKNKTKSSQQILGNSANLIKQLDALDSREKINNFVKELEKNARNENQSQNSFFSTKSLLSSTNIIFLVIFIMFIVCLLVIKKIRYIKQKKASNIKK